jgi:hypothetical protein
VKLILANLKMGRCAKNIFSVALYLYKFQFYSNFMKATFDGQDYMLMLDRSKRELQRLRQEKFEAPLTEHWGNKDLGKVVSLEFADNSGNDGIELKYLPEGAESWEAIQRVQIKVNERAYSHVKERRQFGTRYNGSDKIEIFDGDLRFDF